MHQLHRGSGALPLAPCGYVRTASQANDVPREHGQLSDALKERLAQQDLLDLEVLLRYRGVRTLRALESLETNERAVLLCKARELYELLGIFPSNLKKALDRLFGDEASAGSSSRVLSTNPWPAWVCWHHGERHVILCSCLCVSAVGGCRRQWWHWRLVLRWPPPCQPRPGRARARALAAGCGAA